MDAGQRLHLVLESAVVVSSAGTRGLAAWAHPEVVSAATGQRPPNVVLISIDTLRADRLSLNGYALPTSPEIDSWAAGSAINFPNTVAAAPWTLPSHVSMFSGLDAAAHGVNYRGAASWPRTLPEILHQAGYLTLAVTGGLILHPSHGFHRGFDSFRWRGGIKELGTNVEHVLDRLKSLTDRPFFLLFHTYEVHSPYWVRQPHYDRLGLPQPINDELEVRCGLVGGGAVSGFTPAQECERQLSNGTSLGPLSSEEMSLASDLYDSGVAYADAQIGRIVRRFSDSDLREDTLIVLTSDHGEALGEHGLAGHHHLCDHDLLVPLVVASPRGVMGGTTVQEQVRTIDMVPTVLELLGHSPPAGLDGVSLVPLMKGIDSEVPPEAWSYAANTNRGVAFRLENRLKFIFANSPWLGGKIRNEAFDLFQDPGEMENLVLEARYDSQEFQKQALIKLTEVPGLRIHLANATLREMIGKVRSAVSRRLILGDSLKAGSRSAGRATS